MANKAICALTYGDTHVFTLPYGECSTAAGTAAKVVAVQDGKFALEKGARVCVKFTITNTASNPTLNVSSTGAKSIMYRGSAISKEYLSANRIYEFVYDGTDWELIGDIDTNTKTTASSTNTSSKIFLIGATTQGSGKTTYSHDTAYVGTDGCLYSNSKKVATVAELNEVKTSVSEGKALIAAAVTDKGVSTAADATFQTMANNIAAIPSLQLNGGSIIGKFAPDVNIGDFITTESGKLEGMSMGLSYIHSTGANACWLNKDFGLWCDSSDPVKIGIMTNNNSHVTFQNSQITLAFSGNKSYTYYPRLFRITDNIAIIANQRGNTWGDNGCDVAIHTLYCDGTTITQKSSYVISHLIYHGSSGSNGSYPVFGLVPYNGVYKLLVAAGNPSTSSSDSDYSPSWGGAILTIDNNGAITHYRTTGDNYNSKNCVMYCATGDDLSGNLFAFGYNAYYCCPNGSTSVSRYDSTTYNGILTCTARNGYLYYTKSTNLYVVSINGSTLTAVTNTSLGGYGHYIYEDASGVYVYCYVSSAWHLKHYTFNGSTLTLQSDKIMYKSALIGDIGKNYSYWGYGNYHISPVIKDSRYDDVFLISGSSNSKPLAAILNDDYYFIKATSSALGVKTTGTTTSVIPNLI